MIPQMDEMVIGMFFKYNKSLTTFVLFYDVSVGGGGGGGYPPLPPDDSCLPRLERSQVRGELPKHLRYCTVNSLYVQVLLPRLRRNLGDFLCPFSNYTHAYYLVR